MRGWPGSEPSLLFLHLTAPAAAQPAGGPPALPSSHAEEPPPDGEPIDVRLRAGLSAGAGMARFSSNSATVYQPSFNLAGRLGVQVGSVFSLYYQNMATVVPLTNGSGVVIVDYNAVLADVTVGNHFGLGLGPSVDVVSLIGNSASGTGDGESPSVTGVGFGLHGRMAWHFGGDVRHGPRREGFSLGLDVHPTFASRASLLTLQLALGYEWY